VVPDAAPATYWRNGFSWTQSFAEMIRTVLGGIWKKHSSGWVESIESSNGIWRTFRTCA